MSNRIEQQETIDELKKFISKYRSGNTFAIVVRTEEGKEEIHPRIGRPCYGEMRNYKEKSKNRPDDRFPGDLKNNFPNGTPIGVALSFNAIQPNSPLFEYTKLFFKEYNPWLGKNEEYLTHSDFHYDDSGNLIGLIVSTGDIPPTFLVASFMKRRWMSLGTVNNRDIFLKEGASEKNAHLLSNINFYSNQGISLHFDGSVLHSKNFNIDKFLDQNPQDLDDGLLWSDRCDYNRPNIMRGFEENKDLYHIVKYSSYKNFLEKFNLIDQ